MTFSGTSLVTTEQAPIMARAPIVIPGMTKARAPTKASLPIVIFATTGGRLVPATEDGKTAAEQARRYKLARIASS